MRWYLCQDQSCYSLQHQKPSQKLRWFLMYYVDRNDNYDVHICSFRNLALSKRNILLHCRSIYSYSHACCKRGGLTVYVRINLHYSLTDRVNPRQFYCMFHYVKKLFFVFIELPNRAFTGFVFTWNIIYRD